MKIFRFNKQNDLIKYLIDHRYVSIKLVIFMDYIYFNNKEFDPDEFIEYLDDNNILNMVLVNNNNRFELDHLLFFPNRFNSLVSNSIIEFDLEDQKLLNIDEVRKILNVTRQTVYNLFNAGKLPYYNIQSQKKVKTIDLQYYINSNKAK